MRLRKVAIITIILFLSGLAYSLKYSNVKTLNKYDIGSVIKFTKLNGVPKTVEKVDELFNNRDIDINECHSLLHATGHAAYEFFSSDLKAVALAGGNTCSFGFQHGVEAQIVLQKIDNTELMFNELHNYCEYLKIKHSEVECYHGAGHAFVQLGQSILNALKNCDTLAKDNQKPNECYRGAFSEYINRMRGIDGDTDAPIPGVEPKKIDAKNTYDECLSMPIKYQESCIAQFTSFLYTDYDLEKALSDCNYFGQDVGNMCAFKIGGTYTSMFVDNSIKFVLPKNLRLVSRQTRNGFISGVVNQFEQYGGEARRNEVISWCNNLTVKDDNTYCKSLIW